MQQVGQGQGPEVRNHEKNGRLYHLLRHFRHQRAAASEFRPFHNLITVSRQGGYNSDFQGINFGFEVLDAVDCWVKIVVIDCGSFIFVLKFLPAAVKNQLLFGSRERFALYCLLLRLVWGSNVSFQFPIPRINH